MWDYKVPDFTVGMELVERPEFGRYGARLVRVVRLTPTTAITSEGLKYRRKDGHRIGDYGRAEVATDATRAAIRQERLATKLAGRLARITRRNLDTLTPEQIAEVTDTLDKVFPGTP